MSIVLDVLIIVLLFTIFAALHSFIATIENKKRFKESFGNLIAFYRIGYNIFSLASFYLIYLLSPKPHIIIYDLQNPYDLLILIPQFLALAGLVWSFKYICVKEFLGISQVKRYFQKNYSSELDEELTLNIGGPYKYSRHPVYLFSIMFLLFRPVMDLFYLTFFICLVAYFYIGSYYEEKKLIRNFGEEYIKYREEVSRIFPSLPLKAYNAELISK